ncbi:MAG: metal-sulfur cluster assembly factor [Nitrospiria bacterium]
MNETPLEEQIRSGLRRVIDPELGVNVIDLGLVYALKIQDDHLTVVMTMTSPACPLNAYLSESIRKTLVQSVPGIKSVEVEFVWSPPWGPEKMTDEARRLLGR